MKAVFPCLFLCSCALLPQIEQDLIEGESEVAEKVLEDLARTKPRRPIVKVPILKF